MAEYINKEDLKFLEIPIAPVLQGEQVHIEQGFLKEWLESVPTADVIEREKIDNAIRIAKDSISVCFKLGLNERAFGMREILEIFEENIEE